MTVQLKMQAKEKRLLEMPPEPQTVPTYDLDGIAIRIPALSIPDQGPTILLLALNEFVEILGKRLDLCSGGSWRKRFKLTLSKISITSKDPAFLVPLLKENILRIIENVVSNIITSCHFLLRVCVK